MCFSATKCFAPMERGSSSGSSCSINIWSRWDRRLHVRRGDFTQPLAGDFTHHLITKQLSDNPVEDDLAIGTTEYRRTRTRARTLAPLNFADAFHVLAAHS
jgi:hypothetical protein